MEWLLLDCPIHYVTYLLMKVIKEGCSRNNELWMTDRIVAPYQQIAIGNPY